MVRYLDNTGFKPKGPQPVDITTPSSEESPIPEAWAWLVQKQAGYDQFGKKTADYFVTDDSYIVYFQGVPTLVFPDADGKITPNSYVTESDFKQNILANALFDKKGIRKLQNQLKSAGFLGADYVANGTLDPEGSFINAALLAARATSAQNLAMSKNPEAYGAQSPLDLTQYLKNAAAGGVGGYSRTSVSKSFTSFTNAEARGILESFYAEALGRRPNDDEVKKFQKSINLAAKAKPSVTTSTTGMGGTVTQSAGEGYSQADAELAARDLAESKPGASGFITSTKYMDAFMSALGGKVSGV